jgi:hypothetical protein
VVWQGSAGDRRPYADQVDKPESGLFSQSERSHCTTGWAYFYYRKITALSDNRKRNCEKWRFI